MVESQIQRIYVICNFFKIKYIPTLVARLFNCITSTAIVTYTIIDSD